MTDNVKEKTGSVLPDTQPSRRRWLSVTLKLIVPLAVSVGLCWVLMRGIDLGEMMKVVRTQCDFRYIALMLAMSVLPMIFRAMRWGIQLRAIGVDAPLHILCYSIFGTYAVNLVFPRLGEVWRTGYISYRQHAPFPQIFGSMVADRLADTLSVGLIALVTLLVAFDPLADFVRTYPAAYSLIAAILTSPWFWLAVIAATATAITALRMCHGRKAVAVKKFLRGLWGGFAAIFRMKGKIWWLLLTVMIWGCYFAQLYVAFFAFPFTREMLDTHGIAVVLVCFVLTSISMGVPSNGGIGPYQATMLFGLRVFAPAAALASGEASLTFATEGAAFGNLLIASTTALMAVLGLVTFLLIALDRRRSPRR